VRYFGPGLIGENALAGCCDSMLIRHQKIATEIATGLVSIGRY
jgi:hypothetical protein